MNFAGWLLDGKEHSPALALLERGREVSYADLADRVSRVAAFVRAHAGEGGSVPVIGDGGVDYVVAYLGVIQAGAVAALLPPMSDATRGRVVRELNARLVLTDAPKRGEVSLVAAAEHSETCREPAPGDPGAAAMILYTSGSTGRPRGVMLSAASLQANTEAILAAVPLGAADRACLGMPIHYCYGASVIHTHLREGASVFLHGQALPGDAIDALERSEATGLPGVPSMFVAAFIAELARRRSPHLRYVMISGGRLPDAAVLDLREAISPAAIHIRYGATELTAAASFLPPDKLPDKLGSIGRGLPGAPLRVERPDGVLVGPDEVGEIVATGPSVALGYFADAEATARRFRSGAFRTGDLARVDREGDIFIVGRARSFIKSGGHRIAPQEIEDVLARLPGVAEAAVLGEPHPRRGEAVVGWVLPRPGASLRVEELRSQCRALLPPHMVPSDFRIVDALPKTPSGKIRRSMLHQLSRDNPFVRAKDEAVPLSGRLEDAFRRAARFLETTAVDDVMTTILADERPRGALRELIHGLSHVGFMVPAGSTPAMLAAAAVEAGFPDAHATFPSRVVAAELGGLVEGRTVPTTIFVAQGRSGGVETFAPTEDSERVEDWIRRGIATHVALSLRDGGLFDDAIRLLQAQGFMLPWFFPHGPETNGTITLIYLDAPDGGPRVELLFVREDTQ